MAAASRLHAAVQEDCKAHTDSAAASRASKHALGLQLYRDGRRRMQRLLREVIAECERATTACGSLAAAAARQALQDVAGKLRRERAWREELTRSHVHGTPFLQTKVVRPRGQQELRQVLPAVLRDDPTVKHAASTSLAGRSAGFRVMAACVAKCRAPLPMRAECASSARQLVRGMLRGAGEGPPQARLPAATLLLHPQPLEHILCESVAEVAHGGLVGRAERWPAGLRLAATRLFVATCPVAVHSAPTQASVETLMKLDLQGDPLALTSSACSVAQYISACYPGLPESATRSSRVTSWEVRHCRRMRADGAEEPVAGADFAGELPAVAVTAAGCFAPAQLLALLAHVDSVRLLATSLRSPVGTLPRMWATGILQWFGTEGIEWATVQALFVAVTAPGHGPVLAPLSSAGVLALLQHYFPGAWQAAKETGCSAFLGPSQPLDLSSSLHVWLPFSQYPQLAAALQAGSQADTVGAPPPDLPCTLTTAQPVSAASQGIVLVVDKCDSVDPGLFEWPASAIAMARDAADPLRARAKEVLLQDTDTPPGEAMSSAGESARALMDSSACIPCSGCWWRGCPNAAPASQLTSSPEAALADVMASMQPGGVPRLGGRHRRVLLALTRCCHACQLKGFALLAPTLGKASSTGDAFTEVARHLPRHVLSKRAPAEATPAAVLSWHASVVPAHAGTAPLLHIPKDSSWLVHELLSAGLHATVRAFFEQLVRSVAERGAPDPQAGPFDATLAAVVPAFALPPPSLTWQPGVPLTGAPQLLVGVSLIREATRVASRELAGLQELLQEEQAVISALQELQRTRHFPSSELAKLQGIRKGIEQRRQQLLSRVEAVRSAPVQGQGGPAGAFPPISLAIADAQLAQVSLEIEYARAKAEALNQLLDRIQRAGPGKRKQE